MSNPDHQLKAYDQLCQSYRAIDDFRAKLLGFLPLATGTGIWILLDKVQTNCGNGVDAKGVLAGVGLFGALITLGLFAYEIYGIKKCGALIMAGKQIETSLGMNHGQFKSRPQNVARIINEPFAAGIVYPAVLAAWTSFALVFSWPEGNPLVPLLVFSVGLTGTLIYDCRLRRTG